MIDRICDEENIYMIPNAMKHQLLIYRFSARMTNYMSKQSPSVSSLPRKTACLCWRCWNRNSLTFPGNSTVSLLANLTVLLRIAQIRGIDLVEK